MLLAFGAAESIDKIGPFLERVMRGKPVSEELVERTRERYELIGGSSPLLEITRAQAAAIEEIMRRKDENYKVYVGMRFGEPLIRDAIGEMLGDGVAMVAAAIMSPINTLASTGGYARDVARGITLAGGGIEVEYINGWHLQPAFIKATAARVEEALKVFDDKADALVIFSAHSLPMTLLEGDAYEMQVNQSVNEVVKLTGVDYRVGYQSKGNGRQVWLGPSTDELIVEAKKTGRKGVVIVPIGFAADHVETLYDIDILYRKTAESLGLVFARSESINTDPAVMEMLATELLNVDRRMRYGE